MMRFARWALVAVFLLAATVLPAQIQWRDPSTLGEDFRKPLIVYFHSDDSLHCMELDESAWPDRRVIAASEGRIPVRVDVTSDYGMGVARRLNIYRVPSILLMDGGREERRAERVVTPQAVLDLLAGREIREQEEARTPDAQVHRHVEPGAENPGIPPGLDLRELSISIGGESLVATVRAAGSVQSYQSSNYQLFLSLPGTDGVRFQASDQHRGATHLLEGMSLYVFEGSSPTEWKWRPSAMTSARLAGNEVSWEFPLTTLGGSAPSRVWASSIGSDWNLATRIPGDGPFVLSGQETAQSSSGGAPPRGTLYEDGPGDTQEARHDIHRAWLDVEGDYLHLTVEMGAEATPALFVLLDTDNNPATGYTDGSRRGADVLIEGGRIYRHSGAAQVWEWDQVGEAEVETDGNRIRYRIPRSRIGLVRGATFNFWIASHGDDWLPRDYLPDFSEATFEGN